MTHHEYAKAHKPARPCTAHDLNFGGSCFNCGFDPAMTPDRRQSSPEYRERVHRFAETLVEMYDGDYDEAVSHAERFRDQYPGESHPLNVLALLTRRAATINCPQPR